MAVDADVAARRYRNGIQPYVDLYSETAGADNSEDVQDAFIQRKQNQGVPGADELARRYKAGYQSNTSIDDVSGSGL